MTLGGEPDLPGSVEVGVADQTLGHSEHLLQAAREGVLHSFGRRLRQLGATDQNGTQRRGCFSAAEMIDPQHRNRWHQGNHIDPMAIDQGQTDIRRRRGREYDSPSGHQHPERPWG